MEKSQLEKIKFELATPEQKKVLEEGEDYLKKHKIQELFEVFSNIIRS